jgi:hypothetical protein
MSSLTASSSAVQPSSQSFAGQSRIFDAFPAVDQFILGPDLSAGATDSSALADRNPVFDLDSGDFLPDGPEPCDPIDLAYHVGRTLASHGLPAACPADATPGERLAWQGGVKAGQKAAHARSRSQQTLAEQVTAEADRYRRVGDPVNLLIAETLGNLARGIRSVQARTPDQYRERVETVERDQQYDDWHRAEEQGYLRGLREGGLL